VLTERQPGDAQAFQALLDAGFHPLSTWTPLSCCITAYPRLAEDGGGHSSQFDHKTDHILTNDPQTIRLVRSTVTGLQPANGFWSSDHAGLVSALKLR
jgi:hypothetical protein